MACSPTVSKPQHVSKRLIIGFQTGFARSCSFILQLGLFLDFSVKQRLESKPASGQLQSVCSRSTLPEALLDLLSTYETKHTYRVVTSLCASQTFCVFFFSLFQYPLSNFPSTVHGYSTTLCYGSLGESSSKTSEVKNRIFHEALTHT